MAEASFVDPATILSSTPQPEKPAITAYKRELERRAQDSIRVYNPLEEDVTQYWDGRGFPIPGKNRDMGYGLGQTVIPRYLAENYVKTQIAKFKGEMLLDAVKKENLRRLHSGMATMTVWLGGEEQVFSSRFLTQQADFDTKMARILWVRVEKQFGLDVPASPATVPAPREVSIEETLGSLQDLEAPITSEVTPTPKEEPKPIQLDNKANLAIQKEVRDALEKQEAASGIPTIASTTETPTTSVPASPSVTSTSAAPAVTPGVPDLTNKNVFELQKIAREKGIEFVKTDKKSSLVEKIQGASK